MTENIVIQTLMSHTMGIVNFLLVLCGKQDFLVHSFFPSTRIDATSKNRVYLLLTNKFNAW